VAQSKKGLLADLFDGTFRVLPRTWLTSIACGGILFIPGSILYGLALGKIFALVPDLARGGESVESLFSLGVAYLLVGAGALLQGLAMLFVRACVTEQAARVSVGTGAAPILAVARHVFLHRFGRLIGQRALQWTILGVTIGAGSFIAGALLGLGAAHEIGALPTIAGVLVVLGAYGVTVWFGVRWSLTLETVVVEEGKAEASLDRSSRLVQGAWWRVLGYTLLLGLMVSFAVSLVATPLVFFATIRIYAQFLSGLLSGNGDAEGFTASLTGLFAGMGVRFALLLYVQSLFNALVVPVFMTLLFLGLRERTDAAAVDGATP
jgi:hypothetical protein